MSAREVVGRGGLPALELETSAGSALVYLHGAHVASWRPAGGEEMLFVSAAARFVPGAAIRGGVPVCFPQFAELGPLPMHGFAHTQPWRPTGLAEAGVTLELRDSAGTRALWPHAFSAALRIALEPDRLVVRFGVHNTGDAPLAWSGTLHTYLALDAARTRLHGLGPAHYRDRARGSRETDDPGTGFRVAGHTDRAYLDAAARVIVDDGQRRLVVEKAGFRDTVVWNPGPETEGRFPDLAAGDHARFVCVEAAEVRPVTVEPGATWQGQQGLRRESS